MKVPIRAGENVFGGLLTSNLRAFERAVLSPRQASRHSTVQSWCAGCHAKPFTRVQFGGWHMMKREMVRERYLRDAVPIRLGGLAANLRRIMSLTQNAANRDAVSAPIYARHGRVAALGHIQRAYNEMRSCPLTPFENRLEVAVRAWACSSKGLING